MTASSAPSRIGLVGCGRWGKLILRDLVQSGAEVHVACLDDGSVERARQHGAASVRTDFRELPPMDGYVVATPTVLHAEVVEWLLTTDRPIFCEKPLTHDVVAARRIARLANGRVFVMDKWRYHPAVDAMRAEIASGRVGDVLSIRCVRWQWSQPHDDVSALWILAPHDLSIVQHLVGRVPPLVGAFPACAGNGDTGVTAHFGAPGLPSVMIDIGVASPEHRRRCLVIGTRATMELRDGYDTRLFVRDGAPGAPDATERIIEVGDAMPLLAELQRFLSHVDGGPEPLSPIADALHVVERLSEVEALLATGAR